uniref:RING-type E3 ubiquitin transferase n=1 Tax=Tetraselmis sp. GSL018 TaxID=582737 RepID=A0A061RNG7_9CHLO|mmetsp:Transcript_18544/g.44317  ORF Transcript_18544/g.44317 Transcript_18544/m.44317 type:complete len:363 (-) Transcript_18544:528-1616(-)
MAFTSEPSSGDMVGEVVVISSDSEVEIVEEVAGARHELPSCPICLNDILDPKEKAVVTPCFHVFCRSCLQRWLQQKNLCPLCKGRVRTYIYKILDDNQFSEKVLPPSPPRSPRMDPGNQWPHLSMRGLWTSRSAHPTGPRSSRAPNHNRVDRERAGPSRAESSISQPRPYYWRVQRGCHRLGTRGDTTAAAGQAAADPCALQHAPPQPPTPVQRALLFRRRVYAENMWAAGLADGAGPRAPVADDTVLQQRLREWIMRELKALLREEDVSFLTMYFMGLCASQGLPPSPSSGDNRAGLSSGRLLREYLERRERGEAALSNELLASMLPFLGSSSAHFWHELKSVCTLGIAPLALLTLPPSLR